jgi:ATP-dependent protease ClpP protease subunit
MNRRIAIIGEINTEAYAKFSDELYEIENEFKGKEESHYITLELSSEGGSAELALAFSDRIRTSTMAIYVKAYGLVASAAVLILASGDKRYMAKNAWVMVHEEGLELEGDVSGVEKQVKHYRRLEDQWAYLLSSMTETSIEEWNKLHKAETYLNAKQCLELGLIDKVI